MISRGNLWVVDTGDIATDLRHPVLCFTEELAGALPCVQADVAASD